MGIPTQEMAGGVMPFPALSAFNQAAYKKWTAKPLGERVLNQDSVVFDALHPFYIPPSKPCPTLDGTRVNKSIDTRHGHPSRLGRHTILWK